MTKSRGRGSSHNSDTMRVWGGISVYIHWLAATQGCGDWYIWMNANAYSTVGTRIMRASAYCCQPRSREVLTMPAASANIVGRAGRMYRGNFTYWIPAV